VVFVPSISIEVYGGIYMENIAKIQSLKIVFEHRIVSGMRQIKVIVGGAFIEYISAWNAEVKEFSITFKA
jgi:alanyl-tRNA synthetase